MDAPHLYTADEVAAALRVSRRRVHGWARDGHIKAIWLPGERGNLRVSEPELTRLLQESEQREPAA